MPACYYIIGPCNLTSACCRKIDDMFKAESWHAVSWPLGDAARTCPFCASGLLPGTGELFTMVCHMLFARSRRGPNPGFAFRLMMQLVCSNCTKRMLKKVVKPTSGEHEQSECIVGVTDTSINARPMSDFLFFSFSEFTFCACSLLGVPDARRDEGMGWLRLLCSFNCSSLLQNSPIKETIFCKRDL